MKKQENNSIFSDSWSTNDLKFSLWPKKVSYAMIMLLTGLDG